MDQNVLKVKTVLLSTSANIFTTFDVLCGWEFFFIYVTKRSSLEISRVIMIDTLLWINSDYLYYYALLQPNFRPRAIFYLSLF